MISLTYLRILNTSFLFNCFYWAPIFICLSLFTPYFISHFQRHIPFHWNWFNNVQNGNEMCLQDERQINILPFIQVTIKNYKRLKKARKFEVKFGSNSVREKYSILFPVFCETFYIEHPCLNSFRTQHFLIIL